MTVTANAKPNLPGGNYKAIDSCDGFVILRDVPIMSEVPKGVKGAPSDIGSEWLDGALKFGDDSYTNNKIAYPLHVSHHDDAGLTKPEFAGFFRPVKRGSIQIDGKDKSALFADFKVKRSIFERIQKGELPYISPEIRNWGKQRISSVALLDSEPPHFPFPMVTVGEVTEDPYAKFSSELPGEVSIAKFDGMERVTFDPTVEDEKETEVKPDLKEKQMADDKKPVVNEQAGKPNSNPVDQKVTEPASNAQSGAETIKMSEDPKMAARFAAMEDRNALLEKRLNEREAAEKASALELKALESMKGYQIGDKAKAKIAQFAAKGEEELNSLIETLKEVTPKDSPRTFGAAEASNVSPSDPAVAKFAQQGPDKLEAATRFASEYRTLKAHPAGRGMQITEEQYVKFQMDSAEGSSEQHWGVNFGIKN